MLNMYIFLETAASGGKFPIYFIAVYVIGFIAAVTIGSFAWYNSKRPPGWEEANKPNFVPEMKDQDTSETDT
jgi:hypothetical protein